MKKRLMTTTYVVSLLVLFLLIPGNAFPSNPTDTWKTLLEPINPDFIAYMNALKRSEKINGSAGSSQYGYVPAPLKLSHVKGAVDEAVNIQYPASFDLRREGTVTNVKDQGPYYTCWAFASYASLESCLLPEEHVDFSEWHLSNEHGFDYDLRRGGNAIVTGAYLLRWSGPVSEEVVRYPVTSQLSSGSQQIVPVAKHVQQIVSLPERTGPLDNNTIKYFITNYGPVDFAMHWGIFYDQGFRSYYSPYVDVQNHRLAICGWDDNYPASNFIETPPGNGAFIARNSWGTSWGDRGYVYISYYEMSLQEFTCYNNAEPIENHDSIYQYDILGRSTTWGEKDSMGANVFTAINARPLDAVGFFTNDSNVTYEIYIYKNLSPTATSPIEGQFYTYQSATITYPGYYTIQLDSPVPLQAGEKFSVVVCWHNPDYPHAVSIEMPIFDHNSRSVANPGESYVSVDGTSWEDLTNLFPNTNVCIKAYTEYPTMAVLLTGQRKAYRAWLISRFAAEMSFTIPDMQNNAISSIVIYRSVNGAAYSEYLSLTPSQVVNNQYSFIDRYLDAGSRYSYRVVVYNDAQLALGRSSDVIL